MISLNAFLSNDFAYYTFTEFFKRFIFPAVDLRLLHVILSVQGQRRGGTMNNKAYITLMLVKHCKIILSKENSETSTENIKIVEADTNWLYEEYKPETLADVNLDLCLKAREETKELEDRHERLKARYKRLFKRYYRLYHDRQIALINKITELGEEIEVLHTRNAEYQLEAARWKRMYQGLCESIIDTVKDNTFGERR